MRFVNKQPKTPGRQRHWCIFKVINYLANCGRYVISNRFLHWLQNILTCMLTIVKHSLLHNYFKFLHAFYFNLFKQSLISRSKNYITNHHVSGSCLTQLYNISLSQQVHLHSLLDLICPSVSKIFQSIFKLLDRICWLTRIPSVKKFSPWSDYLEYKRKVLRTTTKLKDKAIWNAEVVCQFAYMYNYKHLLTANQKQDILNALQTGGGGEVLQ